MMDLGPNNVLFLGGKKSGRGPFGFFARPQVNDVCWVFLDLEFSPPAG